MIPELKELLTTRVADPAITDEALRIWLARNPTSPFKTREDVQNSPDLGKIFPPDRADPWRRDRRESDSTRFGKYLAARQKLMVNLLKAMADHHLDAIVHKSVEHQPTLMDYAGVTSLASCGLLGLLPDQQT